MTKGKTTITTDNEKPPFGFTFMLILIGVLALTGAVFWAGKAFDLGEWVLSIEPRLERLERQRTDERTVWVSGKDLFIR